MKQKKLLMTGSAGFIGSAVIRHIINNTNHRAVNIDKLTYAGNLEAISSIENDDRYSFKKLDICNFSSGIKKTVEWYLKNKDWCESIRETSYKGQRLGIISK